MAVRRKRGGGPASLNRTGRRGRRPAFDLNGHSTTKRYADAHRADGGNPMMRRRLAVLCLGAGLASCDASRRSDELSEAQVAALSDTVRSIVRDYAAAFATVNCQDFQPLLEFFDYSGSGFLDVSESTATAFSGEAWPQVIRDAVCSRDREELTVDSLLVRVHSPDVVSTAWTFRATYVDTSGTVRDATGTALQVWHRTADGWKTPVIMSSHRPAVR
jgi:ketosteroid isomerase-like protein